MPRLANSLLALTSILLLNFSLVCAQTAPATAPTTQRNQQAIIAEIRAASEAVRAALSSPAALQTAEGRKAAAPKAIPALKHLSKLFQELSASEPQASGATDQINTILVIFEDTETVAAIQKTAAGTGPQASVAKAQLAAADYVKGAGNADLQNKALDQYGAALKANPNDQHALGLVGMFMQTKAASPEVSTHFLNVIKQNVPAEMSKQITEQVEGELKLQNLAGKPLTITGKQPDGKDFSTADWKGKVVLVDFWATWCGPCVAELPRVKKIYEQYHDKGLEILGVSNDYSADDLTQFTKKESLPWPQLFNADAAKKQEWNPITTGFGIHGIPTMFLIDRKGVLRSVEARSEMEELVPKLLEEKAQ